MVQGAAQGPERCCLGAEEGAEQEGWGAGCQGHGVGGKGDGG